MIARLAAQLMYQRIESEYYNAKRKAARQLGFSGRNPRDLPSNREIRDEIYILAHLMEGEGRTDRLRRMRIDALRMMRLLERFRPRLIGSVWTGHIREGSDIDLHLFADSLASVTNTLNEAGYVYEVEHKRVRKHNQERVFTHIHIEDRHPVELTIYAEDLAHYVFRSSITGKAIEKGTTTELEARLRQERPEVDLDAELERAEDHLDRFELYQSLLEPLEDVRQSRVYHPEGDALFHSLQVFELARRERAYDEEFLTAGLLHDVGKAIDPSDHVGAALEALDGTITERTAWLIAHHMEVPAYHAGTLGHRARRRLEESEDFEDLIRLGELDQAGRQPGAEVPELDEALDYLRRLDQDEHTAFTL